MQSAVEPTSPEFSPKGEGARQWLPLLDYSVRTGVSLSTLRRYIKAGRIEFRQEDGRYLLPLEGDSTTLNRQEAYSAPGAEIRVSAPAQNPLSDRLKSENARLEMELQKAREENAELRMLVALYEETISSSSSRPGNA
jgi:hypothetical protein